MTLATERKRQGRRWLAIAALAAALAATSSLARWRDDHAILINTTQSLLLLLVSGRTGGKRP